MDKDELIKFYASEIERIINDGTAGDYTWEGVLSKFASEILLRDSIERGLKQSANGEVVSLGDFS